MGEARGERRRGERRARQRDGCFEVTAAGVQPRMHVQFGLLARRAVRVGGGEIPRDGGAEADACRKDERGVSREKRDATFAAKTSRNFAEPRV